MQQLRLPVSGLLFDNDGVLVDSLEPAAVAWDAWAAVYAPAFDFRTQVEHGVRASDTVATLVAPEVFDEAIAALDKAELDGSDVCDALPGAVELTRSLPAERWAVVTSAIRPLGLARLAAAGHPTPPAVISADDVSRGKPDPEPYLMGAEALGVSPDECAVFEDAPAGIAAARAAGVKYVIGVGDHLEGAVVDAHVHDLSQVSYDGSVLTVSA